LEKIEMKKTLVAVAALAAVTGAMAEVTISGLVDASVTRTVAYDKSAATTATTLGTGAQWTGGDLNIGGKESLGGGLTARFNYGFQVDTMTGSSSTTSNANYVSYIGLNGGFGDFQMGQFFSLIHGTNAAYDATGYSQANMDMQVTQAASGSVGTNTGQLLSNQVQYTLPVILTGLDVKLAKVLAGPSYGDATMYGATYSAAGFSAGYATSKDVPSATTTNAKTSMGVSYDFGMAKVFYSGQTRKLSTATTSDTGTQYGVSVPFGATSFSIQQTSYSMPSVAVSTKGSGYNIMIKHDLSKRTSLVAQTGSTKISAGTNNGDTNAFSAVGLWHSF